MSYHIFLVGESNFKKCAEKGVYGLVEPPNMKQNAEVMATAFAVRPDDFVFFYVKNQGIHGLWKVVTETFYDDQDIWGDKEQKYPYRFLFEPTVRKFVKPVALSDVLDLKDKGKLWTFDLGIAIRKNQFMITAEEGKEIIRLLLRNNPIYFEAEKIADPYKAKSQQPLALNLICDSDGRLQYEGSLNAWIMKSLKEGKLKDLIGDYKDFLNFVPTSFNNVMDIFLTHVTPIDSVEILHKFTCLELKTGVVTEDDLSQVIRYENWLIRKLAGGDVEMIQSILIGFDFDKAVLGYRDKRKLIEDKAVRLIQYKADGRKNNLTLTEV